MVEWDSNPLDGHPPACPTSLRYGAFAKRAMRSGNFPSSAFGKSALPKNPLKPPWALRADIVPGSRP